MKLHKCFVLLCASLSTSLIMAADFDGSRPLICANIESHDCNVGETCQKGLPKSVGMPMFMRIDFAKKTVGGPKSTVAITSMTKGEKQLLLQGTELGFAWTLAIDSTDGSMSASLMNRDSAFVLFGECTPQ